MLLFLFYFHFLKRFYLFIFRESGREKEREAEKHQCVREASMGCFSAHNLGMCPDWESNQQPFGVQAGAQSTEAYKPGHNFLLQILFIFQLQLTYNIILVSGV